MMNGSEAKSKLVNPYKLLLSTSCGVFLVLLSFQVKLGYLAQIASILIILATSFLIIKSLINFISKRNVFLLSGSIGGFVIGIIGEFWYTILFSAYLITTVTEIFITSVSVTLISFIIALIINRISARNTTFNLAISIAALLLLIFIDGWFILYFWYLAVKYSFGRYTPFLFF